MKARTIALSTLSALVLWGCGGEEDTITTDQAHNAAEGLVYSYPAKEQEQVPTTAPVALRFSSNITESHPAEKISIQDQSSQDEDEVELETEMVDNGRGVMLTPNDAFEPRADYTIELESIELANGASQARTLEFSTQAATEGPRSEVAADSSEGLEVVRRIPDGNDLPVMDFSSFRVQFNQPLDRGTASYGDGETVNLQGPNGTVDAHMLVDGPYLTVDPADDLEPGTEYTLELGSGLESTYGDAFGGDQIAMTPQDSGNTSTMIQEVAESDGGAVTSKLTGKPVNMVPMESTLMGDDNQTQQSGTIGAELAHIPSYPDSTPLRIKRGSMLSGSSIEVFIGGEVPAGFESGDVNIHFVSDATGYLLENPYTNDPEAPRQLRLFMDVAISTENPEANGAVTQDLLHLELVGTAKVEDGRLVADAVSVAQPRILGSEDARSVISFHMKSFLDQDAAPRTLADSTPPQLQSWNLDDNSDQGGEDKKRLFEPGNPIILNFSEPLDPSSVRGKVSLTRDGNPMNIDYHVDGSALVVAPQEDLQYSNAGSRWDTHEPGSHEDNQYNLQVQSGITDLAGNTLQQQVGGPFKLPASVYHEDFSDVTESTNPPGTIERRKTNHAPVILASYPGYPCALREEFREDGATSFRDTSNVVEEEPRDLSNGVSGVCAGAFPGVYSGTANDRQPMDDKLPVMDMPKNRPIIVSFAKEIDPSSVVLGDTFIVEKIDENENVIEEVSGNLQVRGRHIKFWPEEQWDAENNALYRYRIASSGYVLCQRNSQENPIITINEDACGGIEPTVVADNSAYTCGVNAVCGEEAGLPIQTNPLGTMFVRPAPEQDLVADPYIEYAKMQAGPDLSAGGPDYVQFFRAASEANSVLQHLNTQPVSDTNRNFFSERTNTGVQPDSAFTSPGGIFDFSSYESEYGPTEHIQPEDPGYNPDIHNPPVGYDPNRMGYDRNGMIPARNSAKLISRHQNSTLDSQIPSGAGLTIRGINTGCSYNSNSSGDLVPMQCPDQKFTFLMSSVFAEVTDEVTDRGVRVKLWPSMVMGTNVDLFAKSAFGGSFTPIPAQSGKQIMRMRYEGPRNRKPVTAWIRTNNDGKPILEAQLHLYVDVPYATEWGIGSVTNSFNMRSYPVSMKLTGAVKFLENGRMAVEQWNTNTVDITLKQTGPDSGILSGYGDFVIPEYGSLLNYVSEPIK